MKTVIRRWCKDCRLSPGHIEYREEKGHHWVIDCLDPAHEETHKLTDIINED